MDTTHVVRLEPVGIEIEADEEETVLSAAFRQGVTLMHGCKEGQCASCKSFVLEGDEGTDFELERYSTFALNDAEKEEGYTLLCRTHAYDDLVIELLHYDEEMIHAGLPIQTATTRVAAVTPVTHDLRHLVLELVDPPSLRFFPGQYVDIAVPGAGATRSFSMANTSSVESGQLEFVVKVYPDGLFSRFLDTSLGVGDQLEVTGPYGMFTLREGSEAPLLFIGGGAGMAPILALLRSLRERGISRPVRFFYGARTMADLCFTEELTALGRDLPDFRFVPALSEQQPGPGWGGEVGLVTDVVARHLTEAADSHCYVCGPPPMVEAALALLERLGVPDQHVFHDKFTTTGQASVGALADHPM